MNLFAKLNKIFKYSTLLFCLVFLYKTNFLYGNEEEKSQQVAHHPGHNKKFGSSGPFIKFDELNSGEVFTKDFFDNYVRTKKPLLMRNLLKNTPAIKLWTDEYLSNIARGYDDLKMTVI